MKKFLSLLITSLMVFNLSLGAGAVEYGEEIKNQPAKTYAQTFSDVPEAYWAFNYIAEMTDRGVLSGYPDGKFYPDSQVTRAEFAKIMTVAASFKIEIPEYQLFTDVDVEEWYAPYVHAAQSYLSAYNQNGSLYYKPNTPALREDIAVALVKLKGYSTLGADLTTLSRMFSDYQSISSDAQKYVAAAVENGLISGYEDGTFRGQNGITRAEASTLLWRAYQYGNENKTYDAVPTAAPKAEKKTDLSYSDETEPTVKPTAKPTASPTKKPSASIDISDTQESKKPYIMKKLSSASVDDTVKMTYDGSNIFYIDSSDNAVYKVSVPDGKKSKYMTTSKMKLEKTETTEKEVEEEITENTEDEETEETSEVEETTQTVTKTITEESVIAEYTSFVPTQVFYDNVNDKLLLIGYYENVAEPYKSPKSNQKYTVIYDITDGDEDLYCEIGGNNELLFQTSLNSDTAIVERTYGSRYMVDISSGKQQRINMYGETLSYMKASNDLYSLSRDYGSVYEIRKYDFSNDSYPSISDGISLEAFGIKNDCYYFWKYDHTIGKISMKTGKSAVLDINTDSKNVDYEDMGNMNNIMERFFVVDDDTIIFYDTGMSAFRILMENK